MPPLHSALTALGPPHSVSTIIIIFFNYDYYYSDACLHKKLLKITLHCFVCLSKQQKRAVLHQTHYVELLMVVDNERVSHVYLASTFLFLIDWWLCHTQHVALKLWTVCVRLLNGSGQVNENVWLPQSQSLKHKCVRLRWVFLFFFLQYNYKNRNHTAVREEVVQIANYVDSVSFPACFNTVWMQRMPFIQDYSCKYTVVLALLYIYSPITV